MTETTSLQSQFWKPFWLLFGLGFLGILALPLILLPLLLQVIPPERTEFSPAGLVLMSLIQPTVLLAIATAAGLKLAPGLGFCAHLVEASLQGKTALAPLGRDLPLAVIAGLLLGGAILGADALILPQLGEAGQVLSLTAHRTWGTTLGSILYGGMTEELLLRWGLMTLLVGLGGRLIQPQGSGGGAIVWGAMVLTALGFGLGHLPIALAQVPFTPWLLFRILVLNGIGGMLFGWLYWKRSLEAAMMAHASTHIAFSALSLLL